MSDELGEGPKAPEAKFGYTEDGVPIVAMKAIINKTGDGLSDAVDVQAIRVKPHGETFIGLRAIHTKDRYDYGTENGFTVATLVQIFSAQEAAFVEEGSIRPQLADTAGKVADKKALEAAGQRAFDLDDPGEDEDDVDTDLGAAADAAALGAGLETGEGDEDERRRALEEVLDA